MDGPCWGSERRLWGDGPRVRGRASGTLKGRILGPLCLGHLGGQVESCQFTRSHIHQVLLWHLVWARHGDTILSKEARSPLSENLSLQSSCRGWTAPGRIPVLQGEQDQLSSTSLPAWRCRDSPSWVPAPWANQGRGGGCAGSALALGPSSCLTWGASLNLSVSSSGGRRQCYQ